MFYNYPKISLRKRAGGVLVYSISGDVFSSRNVSLEDIEIRLNETGVLTQTFDPSGSYIINNLPAGNYNVTLGNMPGNNYSTPSGINVTLGPNATGVNFTVSPDVVTITGKVTLNSSNDSGRLMLANISGFNTSTTTDSNGDYLFEIVRNTVVTITPNLIAGETSLPSSINITGNTNYSNQNFSIEGAGPVEEGGPR